MVRHHVMPEKQQCGFRCIIRSRHLAYNGNKGAGTLGERAWTRPGRISVTFTTFICGHASSPRNVPRTRYQPMAIRQAALCNRRR